MSQSNDDPHDGSADEQLHHGLLADPEALSRTSSLEYAGQGTGPDGLPRLRPGQPGIQPGSEPDLQTIQNPPGNDFHENEYGERCFKCDGVDEIKGSWLLKLSFVAIGCSLRFSWNCIFLSEAYFEGILGKRVLGSLGLTQDTTTLGTMLLYMAFRRYMHYRPWLLVGIGYMAAMCIAIPVLAVSLDKVPAALLYVFVAFNGIFTGTAQALAGALGGLFAGASVDTLVLIGGSTAALVPTILQLSTLRLAGSHPTPHEVEHAHKVQLLTVFPFGSFGLILGMFATVAITNTHVFKYSARKEAKRLANMDKRVGSAKILGRMKVTWGHVVLILYTWATTVFLTSIVPYIKPVFPHNGHPDMFWVKNLPVILLGTGNFGYLAGNLICPYFQKLSCMHNDMVLYLIALLRGLLIVLVIQYIHKPFCIPSTSSTLLTNVFILAVYFCILGSAGLITNLQSGRCQNICGFGAKHLCPIVGTVVWLGIQIGVLAGAGLSFLYSG